jgi:hypothetical protein
MQALNERAMLVSCKVSVWPAAKTDKRVSAEVAAQHAVTERRAGKYRKNCINVDAPEFVAVKKAAGDLKTAHYRLTLPWRDDGVRILPSLAHPEYSDTMRNLRSAFTDKVGAFVAAFPQLVADARVELNGLFNDADYPTDIRAKFGASVHFAPLPAASDFRAAVDNADEIRAQIDAGVAEAVAEAMRDPYQRLFDAVSRMVNRLSDPKAVFHDTLVSNVADLVCILPALNITGDAQLEALRLDAGRMIAGLTPQALRDDPVTRANVAQEAAAIERAMAAFMA